MEYTTVPIGNILNACYILYNTKKRNIEARRLLYINTIIVHKKSK